MGDARNDTIRWASHPDSYRYVLKSASAAPPTVGILELLDNIELHKLRSDDRGPDFPDGLFGKTCRDVDIGQITRRSLLTDQFNGRGEIRRSADTKVAKIGPAALVLDIPPRSKIHSGERTLLLRHAFTPIGGSETFCMALDRTARHGASANTMLKKEPPASGQWVVGRPNKVPGKTSIEKRPTTPICSPLGKNVRQRFQHVKPGSEQDSGCPFFEPEDEVLGEYYWQCSE